MLLLCSSTGSEDAATFLTSRALSHLVRTSETNTSMTGILDSLQDVMDQNFELVLVPFVFTVYTAVVRLPLDTV